ncbi:MAG: radical SAM protein [Thermodesulfobacteriota bacterium]
MVRGDGGKAEEARTYHNIESEFNTVAEQDSFLKNITLVEGFYGLEQGPEGRFVWTQRRFTVELNGGTTGRDSLKFDLGNNSPDNEMNLSIKTSAGETLGLFNLTHGRASYFLRGLLPDERPLSLVFELDRALPPGLKGNDPRELGVRVLDMLPFSMDPGRAMLDAEPWTARPPEDVYIETTTRCNFKCVMCEHISGKIDKDDDFPIELMPRVMNHVKTARTFCLQGQGEAMLSPTFKKTIQELRLDSPKVVLNTNGSLMNEEFTELFLGGQVLTVSFSMDAATAGLYRLIRDQDFDDICSRIKRFIDARNRAGMCYPEVMMSMTLMQKNLEEAPAFVELVKRLGADIVLFLCIGEDEGRRWVVERNGYRFDYGKELLSADPERASTYLREAFRKGEELGIEVRLDPMRKAVYSEPPSPPSGDEAEEAALAGVPEALRYHEFEPRDCPVAWKMTYIAVDGAVNLCCLSNRIYHLGYLQEVRDLEDLWNGERARKYRYLLAANKLPPFCRNAPCKYIAARKKADKINPSIYSIGEDKDVRTKGLYPSKAMKFWYRSFKYSWTDGKAELSIPWQEGGKGEHLETGPEHLQVMFYSEDMAQGKKEVEITLDGEAVFSGPVPVGSWSEDVLLGPELSRKLAPRGHVRVGIKSDTFIPPGASPGPLGVGVVLVALD